MTRRNHRNRLLFSRIAAHKNAR